MSDVRTLDSVRIKSAYQNAERSLREVGRLLRTTHAGKALWAGPHKTAVSGMVAMIEVLERDVPEY